MRFLHTADLQLGLKLRFVPGEAGARLRAQRFDTVRRIAALARERRVDAVLVAGDVFDDNGVGQDTLEQARDAFTAFAPVPVLLLPGNHDAATPDSALARLRAPNHVHVLLDGAPVRVGGGIIYPCPLRQRHDTGDPTRDLPSREPGEEGVRIALAHGGVLEFSETTETPNHIDAAAVLVKGFDYLALGDWHSTLSFGPRVWYPGTPEPTRFHEREPGQVLLVEIPRAGAEPRVEAVPVARSRWLSHRAVLRGDADLPALTGWFDDLAERSWSLVRLTLEGELSLRGRVELDALLAEEAGRLLHLEVERDQVADEPTAEDLQALAPEGFVGDAVDRLREAGTPAARDALRLLYRLRAEVRA
jgi:DNA repair exonuclease SbcCD nuclease subunit